MAKYKDLTKGKSDEELADMAIFLLCILVVRHKMPLLKRKLNELISMCKENKNA